MTLRCDSPVPAYGYVVASVDVRGGGASYGSRLEPFDQPETMDAGEVTEWLASQPWSDGNVGMFGRSYLGITQYMAASVNPPSLKAIFPEMAWFDAYDLIRPGGVYAKRYLKFWGDGVAFLDLVLDTARVDEDVDGSMYAQARAQHLDNTHPDDTFSVMPYRNSWDQASQSEYYLRCSANTYIDEIEQSGVPMYHMAGWLDVFVRDQLLWYANASNPQKLIIGPWHHATTDGFDANAERLRWYDYHLKGIDNGVMDEPGIYYYTMGAPEGTEWRFTSKWPLPTVKQTNYYFGGGRTGTVDSTNDGYLEQKPSKSFDGGVDHHVVDYTTTTGTANRWSAAYDCWCGGYSDMTENDRKGLTYTTQALARDTELTGHPIVHLWVSSTAADGDFFAYLEEVDSDGVSHYITEGTLRASHRALSEAPFKNYLGLPYHRSYEEDIVDLPVNEPVELVFDLHPTSNVFDAGNRIRVTITNADSDNFRTPELLPPPTVSIYRDGQHASYVSLPVNHKTVQEMQARSGR